MAQNPYIRDVNSEQNLLEDLNAEFIRALGKPTVFRWGW